MNDAKETLTDASERKLRQEAKPPKDPSEPQKQQLSFWAHLVCWVERDFALCHFALRQFPRSVLEVSAPLEPGGVEG